MIVDDAADIPYDVGEQIMGIQSVVKNVRKSRVELLLNKQPNPFQDVNAFKRKFSH